MHHNSHQQNVSWKENKKRRQTSNLKKKFSHIELTKSGRAVLSISPTWQVSKHKDKSVTKLIFLESRNIRTISHSALEHGKPSP